MLCFVNFFSPKIGGKKLQFWLEILIFWQQIEKNVDLNAFWVNFKRPLCNFVYKYLVNLSSM
jgi:hypothetical protein